MTSRARAEVAAAVSKNGRVTVVIPPSDIRGLFYRADFTREYRSTYVFRVLRDILARTACEK